MSTWNAIYLRGEIPADARPPVEGRLPVRAVGAWTEIALPGVGDGEAAARELSARAPGEVVWILLQTTASVLSVMHFERGEARRRIEFADGEWRRVEGAPAAWEEGLFSDEELERAREVRDEEDDAALEAAFARRTLAAGDTLPWPREWPSLWRVLGITQAAWNDAHAREPVRWIEGRATSRVTIAARALLLAAIAAFAAAMAQRGDLRGGFVAVSVMLLVAALGAGALRRASLGRWFL